MPTQISYKGAVIASFTGTTKTMTTQGKYLEDDIIITSTEQDELPVGIVNTSYNLANLGLSWTSTAEENI